MSHDSILDVTLLLRSNPLVAATHFRECIARESEQKVGAALLKSVKDELLPPTLFSTWLSITREAVSIKKVLDQGFSVVGRRIALRYARRWLKRPGPQWNEIWNALDGVPGIVQSLCQLSVTEVKICLRMMGRNNNLDHTCRRHITKLFESLCSNTKLSSLFPKSEHTNSDDRPLLDDYLELLPACTWPTVFAVFEKTTLLDQYSRRRMQILLRSFPSEFNELYQQGYDSRLPTLRLLYTAALPGLLDEHRRSLTMRMRLSVLKKEVLIHRSLEAEVLERLSQSGSKCLKTMFKRHLPLETIKDCIDLLIQFYELFENARKHLRPAESSVIAHVIRLWGGVHAQTLDPEQESVLEKYIVTLFGFSRPVKLPETIYPVQLLSLVRAEKRYRLLHLLLLHNYGFDFDSVDDKAKQKFNIDLFRLLPVADALSSLDVLSKKWPSGDFLTFPDDLHLLQKQDPSAVSLLPKLLRSMLPQDSEAAHEVMSTHIQTMKAKAEVARDPLQREICIKCVCMWVNFSGSLECFEACVLWLRRFVRDPITVASRFGETVYKTLLSARAHRILSGMLPDNQFSKFGLKADQICLNVKHANKIIKSLHETMVTAKREPSFNYNHWHVVAHLDGAVVKFREEQSRILRKSSGINDDQLYDIVWEDTLTLCVDLTKRNLVFWETPNGTSEFEFWHFFNWPTTSASAPFLRFMDNLARARDELWTQHRISVDSTTTIIPEPFPRGLPLHFLMSATSPLAGWNTAVSPFIASRARYIALMDPLVAVANIPIQADTRRAIGAFVDDFDTAVIVFLYEDSDPQLRIQRLRQLCNHWLSIFRQNMRMSSDCATELLRHIFPFARCRTDLKTAFTEMFPKIKFNNYPQLPVNARSTDIFEWNPADLEPSASSHIFGPTVFQCHLALNHSLKLVRQDFREPSQKTVENDKPQFWDPRRFSGSSYVPTNIAEGLVICAILLLDQRHPTTDRLLSEPFPSSSCQRYPAIFLDDMFLERADIQAPREILTVLNKILSNVPPSILLQLVTSYMENLSKSLKEDKVSAGLERTAFALLKLLAKGDSPQLARDLISKVLLDHPESSSWHRQLLTPSFLKSMNPHRVNEYTNRFVEAIIKRLKSSGPPSCRTGRGCPAASPTLPEEASSDTAISSR